jgi:hypothetical protein
LIVAVKQLFFKRFGSIYRFVEVPPIEASKVKIIVAPMVKNGGQL